MELNSERLRLRDFVPSDADALFEPYRRKETSEFESWGPHTTPAESRSLLDYWVSLQVEQPRTDYTLATTLSGQVIGLVGLERGFGTETDDLRSAFLGYRIHPNYWRKGFATEAAAALIRYGFESLALHRVHAGCSTTNLVSIRVLEKLGLQREGTSRQSFPIMDTWTDYAIYGLLRKDWLRSDGAV